MDDTATVSPDEDMTTLSEVELRRKWEHCVYVAQTIAYRLTDEDRKARFLARYSAEEGEIEWRNWRIRANDKRRWTEVSIRRADYWLVEVGGASGARNGLKVFQSAGRIIGWLKSLALRSGKGVRSFNPPGGLLVG